MVVKVTKHARRRANERLDVTHKAETTKLFKRALKYGHPLVDFAGEFGEYLKAKKKNNFGVKVYNDNIFIYKNKTMITVFPVPEKYLPIKEYYTDYIKNNPLLMRLYEVVDKNDVLLEVIIKDKNNVVSGLTINDIFENFGIGKTEIKSKNNAIKAYLKRIGELKEEDDDE